MGLNIKVSLRHQMHNDIQRELCTDAATTIKYTTGPKQGTSAHTNNNVKYQVGLGPIGTEL